MAGNVEAAAEGVDHPLARQEAQRGERGVIADAGVAVLDRELHAAVIDRAERHQQRADQLEAAAEVIDVVDLGERYQRLDRDGRRVLLQAGERDLGVVRERGGGEVQPERQHLGSDLLAERRRLLHKLLIARRLLREQALQRTLLGGRRCLGHGFDISKRGGLP